MSFDFGFDLVYRPPKRSKIESANNKSKFDNKKYKKTNTKCDIVKLGIEMVKKFKHHEPEYKPGESATPSRSPRMNMPKHKIKEIQRQLKGINM